MTSISFTAGICPWQILPTDNDYVTIRGVGKLLRPEIQSLLLEVSSADQAGLAEVLFRQEHASLAHLLGCFRVIRLGRGLYKYGSTYNTAVTYSSWTFRPKTSGTPWN